MSEHQVVAFRAIDGPVSEKNLEHMRRQSTRAEITPWTFDNEYHYGDFGGNAAEMLRRGYDFHLHYANFGIRKLMIRLPSGLPDAKAAQAYLDEEAVEYDEDKNSPGGILTIQPFYEAGQLDELWEVDQILDRLLPLRAELMNGDLRPLYLAYLAAARDCNNDPEETSDAPVPAGLDKLTAAQRALAEFYELGEALIAAAAEGAPKVAQQEKEENQYLAWLQSQSEAVKDTWLAQLLDDPQSSVRREILAEFQKGRSVSGWPTTTVDRTVAQLLTRASDLQQELNRKKKEQAARKQAKKLAGMATDPTKTLKKTEELVKQRNRSAYTEIATLLADLREALAGTDRTGLAEQQAQKLRIENPTAKGLVSDLRGAGFLKK